MRARVRKRGSERERATMLLLFETAAGYALFKVLDSGKIKKAKDLHSEFQDLEHAKKMVKLKKFCKFEDMDEALEAAAALTDSKLSKGLKKFLINIVKAWKFLDKGYP